MISQTIRFLKHCVTNGTVRARVFYSLDNRGDRRPCVTLYAKDYSRSLGEIFSAEYVNDTDSHTDYFDQGRVVLFETHPLYAAARERASFYLNQRSIESARRAVAKTGRLLREVRS